MRVHRDSFKPSSEREREREDYRRSRGRRSSPLFPPAKRERKKVEPNQYRGQKKERRPLVSLFGLQSERLCSSGVTPVTQGHERKQKETRCIKACRFTYLPLLLQPNGNARGKTPSGTPPSPRLSPPTQKQGVRRECGIVLSSQKRKKKKRENRVQQHQPPLQKKKNTFPSFGCISSSFPPLRFRQKRKLSCASFILRALSHTFYYYSELHVGETKLIPTKSAKSEVAMQSMR